MFNTESYKPWLVLPWFEPCWLEIERVLHPPRPWTSWLKTGRDWSLQRARNPPSKSCKSAKTTTYRRDLNSGFIRKLEFYYPGFQISLVFSLYFAWLAYKINLFLLVHHPRSDQQGEDQALGWLNHFVVITLNQQQHSSYLYTRSYKV